MGAQIWRQEKVVWRQSRISLSCFNLGQLDSRDSFNCSSYFSPFNLDPQDDHHHGHWALAATRRCWRRKQLFCNGEVNKELDIVINSVGKILASMEPKGATRLLNIRLVPNVFTYASSSTPHPCQYKSVSRWVVVSDKHSLEHGACELVSVLFLLLPTKASTFDTIDPVQVPPGVQPGSAAYSRS